MLFKLEFDTVQVYTRYSKVKCSDSESQIIGLKMSITNICVLQMQASVTSGPDPRRPERIVRYTISIIIIIHHILVIF